MFGTSPVAKDSTATSEPTPPNPSLATNHSTAADSTPRSEKPTSGAEKRTSGPEATPNKKTADESPSIPEKKRRSSSVAKARDIFSSAKNSLSFSSHSPSDRQEKMSALSRSTKGGDPALHVQQGAFNNSAGESKPGPKSTFRVGVTEDKNKKCRRTMEDTHAYLYNFLSTPVPNAGEDAPRTDSPAEGTDPSPIETDNGYFAIFDGHAGTFAADWCGKKLHLVLEDEIRKNPTQPVPVLLDQTFTSVDQQLEKLPLKNSGCTAITAVLRWEDRIASSQNPTGFAAVDRGAANMGGDNTTENPGAGENGSTSTAETDTTKTEANPPGGPVRQRVLYTANVGDARIVLCRNGRALRLSYDHKGSDENEGRRVANAGGLILNNRVNGVLAVTRALGDSYMKDLVTGRPYTTETVIQPDADEFLILACDGLWDVCSDQEAVDLVRNIQDAQDASKRLVDFALSRFSTDNLSCMIVRFDNKALLEQMRLDQPPSADAEPRVSADGAKDKSVGVGQTGISEADAIVRDAARKQGEAGESNAVEDMIIEEEQVDVEDPGPELNAEALREAQAKRKSAGTTTTDP
ncbi:PP2C-domain-containing protein [Eremomyces bilateralis CBS 781.70]|uniref:PP2C-domain-containing protein n=1 Tax=Eremomyces bilateralis CBS 781.70 TaxID=1392243 RepID=A0A6G1GA00_9PEZI|nr:PP2C-domain-containing protein [Eremomyces bilateralis CBS 781.70]KAF1814863.1 PP2C-domain-containing protein [Eremomyces bilateralis CBS 781.70]